MASFNPESTISHYKIRELIASGGMGEVYQALDLQLGRVVALKIVLAARAGDANIHHRFLREARAASILSHPSICTIYEIGDEGNVTFIAMQYLEGKTVEALLTAGPLQIDRALSYALDVAEALEEAHRNGVVHRDIKPSNIIINERQTAVVLDFGLAKQVNLSPTIGNELPTQLQLTSTATLVGTGPYMSPEQILGESLDERSDIFSFGVTLYEMLAGKRPFQGATMVDVLHSILHDKPKPINRVRPEVDETLASIVAKMLAKNKGERYQSAAELKDDLLEYIQTSGYAVRSFSGSAGIGTSTLLSKSNAFANRLNRTRAVFLMAPIVLLAIALIGALWLMFFRPRDSADSALATLKHVQLVNWKTGPGESTDAVFSRDGRMIAFSSGGNNRDIWIKQTKMGDANQITKGEWNSWNPIWSPDSQQIAFLSKRGNQSGIWRMPALGGSATLVAASDDSNLRLRYWSRDGETIYYQSNPDLFAVNLRSGQVTRVTDFEPTEQITYLNFSIAPDEHSIAFIDRKDGQMDIWVQPLRGGAPKRVTNDIAEDRNLVWHPDGKRIIYSSLRDGIYQICAANVDASGSVQLTSGESDKVVLDVAVDGAGILYAVSREESDIWAVTVNAAAESEVTTEPGVEFWPDESPAGNTLAYQSIKNPDQGNNLRDSSLLAQPVGKESGKIQLAKSGINPTWSPDSNRLAFLRQLDDVWTLWTVSAAGGDERQLSKRGVFAAYSILPYNRIGNRFYSWSPDGSRIAYASLSADGSGMWVVSPSDSNESLISSNVDQSLYSPLWSPDGGSLVYVARSSGRLNDRTWSVWTADVRANKSTPIFYGPSAIRVLGWIGAATDLLVATIEGKEITTTKPGDIVLQIISKNGTPQRTLASLKSAYLNTAQLSRDGKVVALVAREDGKDNVWIVSTKGGEARKLTSNMDPRLYYSNLAFSADSQTIYFGKQSSSTLISMIDNFK